MKKLMNLLLGVAMVRAEGMFPERLINLCAQHRADFWGVEWLDDYTITFLIRRRDRDLVCRLGAKIGCTVSVGHGRGLPYLLGRLRRRYGFWVGFGLSLLCVAALSNVVFTIDLEGNSQVPAGQILGELRRQGLRPGVFGPGLSLRDLEQEALLELDGISWMTINLHGTRAQVIVREVVEKPEFIEEEGCFDLIAQADGIILHVDPVAGQAMVEEGDTVAAGDVLIRGTVELKPPIYSDQPSRFYQAHARGRVEARTWRRLEAVIPLTAQVKRPTGQTRTRFSLNLFGFPVDFFKNSSISWPFYDRIKTVYPLTGRPMDQCPIALVREELRAYELDTVPVDREAAQTMLEGELERRLLAQLKEGEVLETDFSARVADNTLRVTLTAQCNEDIGVEREVN